MLSKDNEMTLDSFMNENDSQRHLNNKNPNFNIMNYDFKKQNQINDIENNTSLNNNNFISPLLNNSINIEKELDYTYNQSKFTISDCDWKTCGLDFPSSYTNNNINSNIHSLFNEDYTSSQNAYSKIQEYKKEIKTHRKPTGRIKKEDKKEGNHNKFTDDNLRKKVKHLLIKSIMKFLNKKIKELFNGNIGKNILKKELLTLNKTPKYESTIEYNKSLLKKTLKDIFSEDISTRFTNYTRDFNRNLIGKLINEEDKEKRDYFQKLFGLTLLDCLHHFNRTKDIKELDGMDCIDVALEEFNDDKEYKEILNLNIKNFDVILNRKRSRTSRKKIEGKIDNKNN